MSSSTAVSTPPPGTPRGHQRRISKIPTEPLDRMIGFLGGRIYYCLSHFYLLHKQSPLFPLFAAHWEKMIGLPTSYQTQGERLRIWSKARRQLSAR